MLLNPKASFPLARLLRDGGIALADAFTFTSGLYFRGKIAYARHFAQPERGDLVRVITSNAGLVPPDRRLARADLAAFGKTDIDVLEPTYRQPLQRDARALKRKLGPSFRVILLGSIATPKYREPLLEIFGEHLQFPLEFVGRGDMSRGALMLRAVQENAELDYAGVTRTLLRGKRARKVGRIQA